MEFIFVFLFFLKLHTSQWFQFVSPCVQWISVKKKEEKKAINAEIMLCLPHAFKSTLYFFHNLFITFFNIFYAKLI